MSQSVAIVTGSSSGIGRATAIRLSRDFSAVVLAARGAAKLEGVADQVRANGAEPLAIDLDLMAPAAAEAVVSQTLAKFGRIDALLNIAGAVPGIDLFQMTDEQWNAGMELKLHGARRLTLRAWEALKATKGAVVLIAGNTAEVPTASAAAVGVINAAIVALAKAFADRGLRDGVQVNSVSPGPVMTGRRLSMIEKWASAHKVSLDEAKQTLLTQAGISRYGEPQDIADLMAFLISPAARWMTGTQLRVDGGEVKSI
jgi:NAD(P)-dependent dehydrogenase (short-subunit alcohol dehydrogenase family)